MNVELDHSETEFLKTAEKLSEKSIWQELINAAYARWLDGDLERLRYDVFVEALDPEHREAVVLKNLNYQVLNGGFRQWYDNGYSSDAPYLCEVLTAMDTPASKAAAAIVEQAYDEVITFYTELKDQYTKAGQYEYSRLADFSDVFEEMVNKRLRRDLGALDDSYYALAELEHDIEAWFKRNTSAHTGLTINSENPRAEIV